VKLHPFRNTLACDDWDQLLENVFDTGRVRSVHDFLQTLRHEGEDAGSEELSPHSKRTQRVTQLQKTPFPSAFCLSGTCWVFLLALYRFSAHNSFSVTYFLTSALAFAYSAANKHTLKLSGTFLFPYQ
jgi:hypothetical protein